MQLSRCIDMKYIFKLFMAINSIMIIGIVYSANNQVFLIQGNGLISILFYAGAAVFGAVICLLCCSKLSEDEICGGIVSVELANDSYLPCYLGYFFVALSIKDYFTLVVAISIILIFLICSQNLFYNPLFLLFGYKFYHIIGNSNRKILIISKKDIRDVNGLQFTKLRRINNYTFIDSEGYS